MYIHYFVNADFEESKFKSLGHGEIQLTPNKQFVWELTWFNQSLMEFTFKSHYKGKTKVWITPIISIGVLGLCFKIGIQDQREIADMRSENVVSLEEL
jgi:hypothetical protein